MDEIAIGSISGSKPLGLSVVYLGVCEVDPAFAFIIIPVAPPKRASVLRTVFRDHD
jgi:hypothetical protein